MQCYSIDGRERIYIERERAGEKDYMIVEERESESERERECL